MLSSTDIEDRGIFPARENDHADTVSPGERERENLDAEFVAREKAVRVQQCDRGDARKCRKAQ